MMARQRPERLRFHLLLLLAAAGLALACGSSGLPYPVPATPPATPVLVTPLPTPTPLPPDTGWQTVRPGLEKRVWNLLDADGRHREQLTALRVEPGAYRFDVAYRPGAPQSLEAWQAETGALLVVNGGFFTDEHLATGLIISDGQARGESYGPFAGMFAVTPAGPEVRWLQAQPYNPAETLVAGVQAFPMLIRPSGTAGVTNPDTEQARRTVVAQDTAGNVLFLVAAFGHFTLYDLSAYLIASDLELDVALNLDGGTSSGLYLADPLLHLPSFLPVPSVIAVWPNAAP